MKQNSRNETTDHISNEHRYNNTQLNTNKKITEQY